MRGWEWLVPLGSALRSTRESRGFLATEICDLMKIPKGGFSEYEHGQTMIPPHRFQLFCQIMDVGPNDDLRAIYREAVQTHRVYIHYARVDAGSQRHHDGGIIHNYKAEDEFFTFEWNRDHGYRDQAPLGWQDCAWDRVETDRSMHHRPLDALGISPWNSGSPWVTRLDEFDLLYAPEILLFEEYENEETGVAPVRIASQYGKARDYDKPWDREIGFDNIVATLRGEVEIAKYRWEDRFDIPMWKRIDLRLEVFLEELRARQIIQRREREEMSSAQHFSKNPDSKIARVLEAVKAAGPDGLTSGEAAEWLNENDPLEEDWDVYATSGCLAALLSDPSKPIRRLDEKRGEHPARGWVHVMPEHAEGKPLKGTMKRKIRRSPEEMKSEVTPDHEAKIRLHRAVEVRKTMPQVWQDEVEILHLECEREGREPAPQDAPTFSGIPNQEQREVQRLFWMAHDKKDLVLKEYLIETVAPKL